MCLNLQIFYNAVQQRFANIDVKKNIALSEGKQKDSPLLDLRNEVKIIMSSDSTFALWSKMISMYASGMLINVDHPDFLLCKETKGWKPEKDGALNREFFKWLGGLSEKDHVDMIHHVLNKAGPSRLFKYPKVVIKQPKRVLESCYTYGEWLERRERKHVVRKELQKIKPSLAFFDKHGKYNRYNWQRFKQEYHVSSASMRALLDQPGQAYFSDMMQLKSKNKSTEDVSPYAKAWFKEFLRKRKSFVQNTGSTYLRKYNTASNTLTDWPANRWTADGEQPMKLAVIDFRNTPIIGRGRAKATIDAPFFGDFMRTFATKGQPAPSEPRVWLWISGDEQTETQAFAYSDTEPFRDAYAKFVSIYAPGKFERLDDANVKTSSASKAVKLLWLVKKPIPEGLAIPEYYEALPTHPSNVKNRKYQELEYRVHTNELTMEFLLNMLKDWVQPGDRVFTAFAGTKILIAATV